MSVKVGREIKTGQWNVFNVSAIPIHCTVLMRSPFTDAVVNESLWQCEPLQHDRLLQLINGVELPAAVNSLLFNCSASQPVQVSCYYFHVLKVIKTV